MHQTLFHKDSSVSAIERNQLFNTAKHLGWVSGKNGRAITTET